MQDIRGSNRARLAAVVGFVLASGAALSLWSGPALAAMPPVGPSPAVTITAPLPVPVLIPPTSEDPDPCSGTAPLPPECGDHPECPDGSTPVPGNEPCPTVPPTVPPTVTVPVTQPPITVVISQPHPKGDVVVVHPSFTG